MSEHERVPRKVFEEAPWLILFFDTPVVGPRQGCVHIAPINDRYNCLNVDLPETWM